MMRKFLTLILFFTAYVNAFSQQPMPALKDADSVRAAIDRQPAFGIYKDNYFAIGTTIGSAPTRENSDVKFQISIRQRLTRQELPFHSYLYLFYTQKTLWNVFQESLPMHDMNFNPGIGWSKLLIKDGQVSGNIILLLEHESNGKDGDDSRSWNKIGLSLSHYISPTLMIHGKGFIPIIDGKQNKDILDYTGFVQCSIQKVAQDRRWVFNLTLDKRKGWNLNFNTTVQFGLRLKHEANQYFFLQYYNGYGECLLDYNRFTSALRIGLLIRPSFFSEF